MLLRLPQLIRQLCTQVVLFRLEQQQQPPLEAHIRRDIHHHRAEHTHGRLPGGLPRAGSGLGHSRCRGLRSGGVPLYRATVHPHELHLRVRATVGRIGALLVDAIVGG